MTKAFAGKNAILNAFRERYKHNEDVMVIMEGEPSSGMSGTSIKMAEQMNKTIKKRNKK